MTNATNSGPSRRAKPTTKPAKQAKPGRRPGRPKASVSEDMAKQLLQAAVQAFAERGFDAVSTAEVSRMVGVTQPMVHHYFKSKENLWLASVHEHMRDLDRRFPRDHAELSETDPVSRLKVLTRRLFLMSAKDPTLSKIVIHESLARSPRLSVLIDRYFKRGYGEFEREIEKGIEQGVLPALPIYSVVVTLVVSATLTLCMDAMVLEVYGVDTTQPDRQLELIDSMIDILFNGLDRRTRQ
jgi:AcrR family transcriptional regulator